MARPAITCMVLLCVSTWFTVQSASLFTASTGRNTTGYHIVVVKRHIQTPDDVHHARPLSEIGRAMAAKYNISVLRHFSIGRWRALLVHMGDNRVDHITDDDEISIIEPEMRVQAFPLTKKTFHNEVMKETSIYIGSGNAIGRARSSPTNQTTTPEPIVCYQQSPVSTIWALQRISSHPKPLSYKSTEYLFTSVDQGSGTEVYVADTGIRTTHTEFGGRADPGYVAAGVDEDIEDNHGHGTHVASLVAGTTVGVAKQVRVVNVKVLNTQGVGDVSWIIDGLQWISNRVSAQRAAGENPKAVINLSLGVAGVSYSLESAVQSIIDEMDIPVVAAAGNDNSDACFTSPARMASVVTVGATSDDDTLASFSNYGSCVNILSPGDAVLGAYCTGDDQYAYISGTSQAAPLVTGVLSRYMSSIDGAPPTPALLQAYVTDTASTGYISFTSDIEATTPNKLLYRACESLGDDDQRYMATYPNSTGSSVSVVYIVPILNVGLLLLCLVVVKWDMLPCSC